MISIERQRELEEEYSAMCMEHPSCHSCHESGETQDTTCPYLHTEDCEKAFFFEKGKEEGYEEAKKAVAREICLGCGYLKETECTYTGKNCTTSQPMLKIAMFAIDRLKAR